MTRPNFNSTGPLSEPTIPATVTESPSGSTPKVGMVMVSGSPEVTDAENERAAGGWFGMVSVGSGLTVTVARPVWALAASCPSG